MEVKKKEKAGVKDKASLEKIRRSEEGRYQEWYTRIHNAIISKGGEDFLRYVEEDLDDSEIRSIFLNKIASSDDMSAGRYINDFLDGLMIAFKKSKGKQS